MTTLHSFLAIFLRSEIFTLSSLTPKQNEIETSGLQERKDNFQIFPTVTDFLILGCFLVCHEQFYPLHSLLEDIFWKFLESDIFTLSSLTPKRIEIETSGLRERKDNFQIFPTVTDFFTLGRALARHEHLKPLRSFLAR